MLSIFFRYTRLQDFSKFVMTWKESVAFLAKLFNLFSITVQFHSFSMKNTWMRTKTTPGR